MRFGDMPIAPDLLDSYYALALLYFMTFRY
jgi:hypothetical protein